MSVFRYVRMRLPAGVVLLFIVTGLPIAGAIRFEDFASTEGLSFAGAAGAKGNRIRLTAAKTNQSGAVWFEKKQFVASGFETSFRFQLTEQGGLGHGADGFAFVVQNSGPDALGGRGSAGGFAVTDPNYQKKEPAIPWSIAVFFDTFRNEDERDPSANYVAFCTYGKPSEAGWPAPRLAFTPKLPFHLKDRKEHTALIQFQPPVLTVFLDGGRRPVLKATVDFSIVLDSRGSAWVGFTASTGGGYENHDILSWSFSTANVSSNISAVSSDISFAMSECLPGRNLCTPEHPFIDAHGDTYHIVLPANLVWGASIPNPAGRTATITNAHGIACWDFKSRGAEGCSGPSGNGSAAGAAFLIDDAPAGALVSRTHDGRTWFSINGKKGAAFDDNEGFYEFDVQMN